jgi:hypothetical protein
MFRWQDKQGSRMAGIIVFLSFAALSRVFSKIDNRFSRFANFSISQGEST